MAEKVAVIGAGNGGHALAFDIASRGYRVLLYEHPKFMSNIDGIMEKGGIEAVASISKDGKEIPSCVSGFEKIDVVTADMKTAVAYAQILFMIVPSFAQETLFKLAMPHLQDGQTVVLLPGNFGSLVFRRLMREAGIRKKVSFVESNTIPYACRTVAPGQVLIVAIKQGLGVAALPGSEFNKVAGELKDALNLDLFPQKNVLQAGLNNVNMIVHPATAVLNMGLFESRQGAFYFYREGMSPSVSKVQQKIDDERMSVGSALGLELDSFLKNVKMFYNLDVQSIREFAESSPIHSSFGYDAPKTPGDRYISEDCPFLLVPLYEFGKLTGVKTPAVESIITLASIYNNIDYFQEGRTLHTLGLTGMSRDEILKDIQ